MNDYQRIERIIHYLDEHHSTQPDLATLAKEVNLSQSHFHQLFTRWAGITPKDFLQHLTLTQAKDRLRKGESVFNAALDVGLSGPSRLHDLSISLEAASPGEIKSGGAEWTIDVGFAPSPFGICLVGKSPRGICHLSFVETANENTACIVIKEQWPQARVRWNNTMAAQLVKNIFKPSKKVISSHPLRILVKGTQFQVRVWRALLKVPRGRTVSYQGLAKIAGTPKASRAVGTAMAQNAIAYLIPCHRVIRQTGVLGNYRWGKTRKKAMAVWEQG